MKQTAVVFEAEIGSAGSAIDLNNMSCADIMQGEKTREIKDGEKEAVGECVRRLSGRKDVSRREQAGLFRTDSIQSSVSDSPGSWIGEVENNSDMILCLRHAASPG
ncbi:hypothetical protein JOQ06_012386, partial [Pogonophryne albipinna]